MHEYLYGVDSGEITYLKIVSLKQALVAITGALLSGRLAMDVLTLTSRVPLVLAMNTAVVVSPAI